MTGIIPDAFKKLKFQTFVLRNGNIVIGTKDIDKCEHEIVAEINKLINTIPNFGDEPHDCISRHSMKNLLLGTESEAKE